MPHELADSAKNSSAEARSDQCIYIVLGNSLARQGRAIQQLWHVGRSVNTRNGSTLAHNAVGPVDQHADAPFDFLLEVATTLEIC